MSHIMHLQSRAESSGRVPGQQRTLITITKITISAKIMQNICPGILDLIYISDILNTVLLYLLTQEASKREAKSGEASDSIFPNIIATTVYRL